MENYFYVVENVVEKFDGRKWKMGDQIRTGMVENGKNALARFTPNKRSRTNALENIGKYVKNR